ncbi:MAG: hypothetical protein AAF206_27100, partial [Bacteroidota bacterium]
VLKYMIPAVLVLITVKLLQDNQKEKSEADHVRKLQSEIMRQHLPVRMTAYERAILFLERISPENLLPRVNGAGKPSDQFHLELVRDIRNEFEHNLAQQLYISPAGWQALVNAKEQVLAIINQAAQQMTAEDDGIAMSRKIIETYSQMGDLPTHKATFVLKSDIQKLFKV